MNSIIDTAAKAKSMCKMQLAAICRSGKTYICAAAVKQIIEKLQHRRKSKVVRIVVLTPEPSTTKDSWTAVFSQHQEFLPSKGVRFAVWSAQQNQARDRKAQQRAGQGLPEEVKEQFFGHCDFATKCKVQAHGATSVWQRRCQKGVDVIIYDEAHQGSTTGLAQDAINQLICESANRLCVQLFVTATWLKPVVGHAIPEDHIFYWTPEDFEMVKSGKIHDLAAAHGARHVLDGLLAAGLIDVMPEVGGEVWLSYA